MDYERVLRVKIADYCQHLNPDELAVDVRLAVQHFLDEHSLKISDPERLQALEYEVRGELSNRLLESRLHRRPV